MDAGYKHFTHVHNLTMHQEHDQAAKKSCSGCNSLVIGTTYVCWQCNFVLHEQCFRATRSLKHPSHPSHPLTLFPYPTYPSNSFYCNSCKLIGNGLSYSCSDCEFDLHIHCAHSNVHQHSTVSPVHNYVHGQEMLPQNGPNTYMAQNVYNHTSAQNQNSSAQHLHTHAHSSNYNNKPSINPQYSSTGPNSTRVEENELHAELEQIKLNRQRLEVAREQAQLDADTSKYALELWD